MREPIFKRIGLACSAPGHQPSDGLQHLFYGVRRYGMQKLMQAHHLLTKRLIDSLYVEVMVLADEARGYFDVNGRADRDALLPIHRVGFSCESLRVTTRLMHIIAWLLTHRAVAAGEISEEQATAPERRLGRAQASDPDIVANLPETARQIIEATGDLYARVLRLDRDIDRVVPIPSPARGLMDRLQQAF